MSLFMASAVVRTALEIAPESPAPSLKGPSRPRERDDTGGPANGDREPMVHEMKHESAQQRIALAGQNCSEALPSFRGNSTGSTSFFLRAVGACPASMNAVRRLLWLSRPTTLGSVLVPPSIMPCLQVPRAGGFRARTRSTMSKGMATATAAVTDAAGAAMNLPPPQAPS